MALLIAMGNLTKLSGQKRVDDRREKNDGRNEVERLPLNSPREFSEKRRNLLVMVAIDRKRKVYSRFQYPCSRDRKSSQTQRQSEAKKKQRFTHGTQNFIGTTLREPVVAAPSIKHRKRCNFGKFFARLLVR